MDTAHYKFNISGITCNNCIAKIIKLLEEQLAATEISFSNANKAIEFNTNIPVNMEQLNQLLTTIGNYKINELALPENINNAKDTPDDAASYKPIYIIFAYLIAISIIVKLKGANFETALASGMAGFFLIFSFFKMLDLKGFAEGYSSYDIIAKRFYNYGYIYPFIELAFGIGYISVGESLYLNIVVFIIMSISSIGVIQSMLSKSKFYCACVGTFLKVPLGMVALIEDLSMVVMSLAMIIIRIT